MKKNYIGLSVVVLALATFTTLFAQVDPEYGTQMSDELLRHCNRERAYSTGVSDARKGLARKQDYAEVCRINRDTLNNAYNSGYSYGLTNQSGLVINEPAPDHPDIYKQYPSSYVTPYTRAPEVAPGNPNVAPVVPQAGSSVVAQSTAPNAPGATYSPGPSYGPSYPSEVVVPSGELARPSPEHGLRSLVEIAPSPQAKCIQTPTGVACGFNCVNSMNLVRCAPTPDQVCRSNVAGIIACGYHCIATVKTVRCAVQPNDVCVADNNGNVFCGVNCRLERNGYAYCDLERYAP